MVMMNKCCFFNLQTGAIIIGWLTLASDIFSLVTIITSTSRFAKYTSEEIFSAVFENVYLPMFAMIVVGILADMALLWGACKKQHFILLPWLITSGIKIVSLVIGVVSRGIFGSDEDKFTSMIIVVGIPITALYIYFWFAVSSLYQQFREDETLNNRRRQEKVGFIVQKPSTPICLTKPPPYEVAIQEC